MKRLKTFGTRLKRDEKGATIVEFAFIVGPMFLLLIGGLELGYNSYVRSTMQGALNDAARTAAVEFPIINVAGNTVEEQVENARQDLRMKQLEVDKLELHKKDWIKEVKEEIRIEEGREMDEVGNTIYQSRKRAGY